MMAEREGSKQLEAQGGGQDREREDGGLGGAAERSETLRAGKCCVRRQHPEQTGLWVRELH